MKILVVGSAGREHAICRALMTASPQPELLIAPGNPGTSKMGQNFAIAATDTESLVALAKQESVDWVFIGPEQPLVEGLCDALRDHNIPCCGPSKAAAQLEGSKIYTRQLSTALNLPSPESVIVDNVEMLHDALTHWRVRFPDNIPVIKADGLAGGKGVFLPETLESCEAIATQLLQGEKLGPAGSRLLLEERLFGVEASLFFACDGERCVALPHAQDHKRLNDNDQGPNTGGMGAISPNPLLDDHLVQQIRNDIVEPTLKAMAERGHQFQGFLFVGVMLTEQGPKLLEFNVRLGDPEAQAILPRLAPGAFLKLCASIAMNDFNPTPLPCDPNATCAIVLTAPGYPEQTSTGDNINISADVENDSRWIDEAGTISSNNQLMTHSGRVLAVVARGSSKQAACTQAYAGVAGVTFNGMHYRQDIGANIKE